MLNSTITRKLALLGAVASLAAVAPAAQADQPETDVTVCNQATPHSLGGFLYATGDDPTPPARYKFALYAHPGNGVGLENAASHSPALSVCGDPGGGYNS